MDPSRSIIGSARPIDVQREETEDRPRKRARSQSPVGDRGDVPLAEDPEALQHDLSYYFEDGSTVIRVENVLFKVCLLSLAALA